MLKSRYSAKQTDQSSSVDLAQFLLEDESDKSINEKIAKKNKTEHERIARHGMGGGKFACQDIRVERGEVKSVTLMINTRTATLSNDGDKQSENKEEQQNEAAMSSILTSSTATTTTTTTAAAPSTTANLPTSSSTTSTDDTTTQSSNNQMEAGGVAVVEDISSILDVIDQSDENRLHVSRSGRCHTNSVAADGTFWIQPVLADLQTSRLVDSLSDQIGNFITRTQFKSFGELAMRPNLYSKCFVYESTPRTGIYIVLFVVVVVFLPFE